MNINGSNGRPKVYRFRVHFDRRKRENRVEGRMRKISRKRFIGLAMYYGFSVREAREKADIVLMHGASYRQDYLLLMKAVNEVLEKERAKAMNEEIEKMLNAEAAGS